MSTEWSVRILGLVQFALELGLSQAMTEVAPRHPHLRPAHLQVFRRGSLDSVRVTQLAARSGMTKQSMHELVGHLERQGYVRREPDSVDSRALQVRLTARGHELEGQLRAATARVHLQWLDRLGEHRFAALWSALQDVTERDDPLPDPAELARQAGGAAREELHNH
jgi:DNA-binding MarR family transcriptional regulator